MTVQERSTLASFAFRPEDTVTPSSYLKEGDLVTSDGGNYKVEHLEFKGYVKVWDNRTGVMSLQPRWLLWQTFQLKREDGSLIFTDKDPKISQNYGLDMVCMLHPDSPSYEQFRKLGFRPCLKKHTPTQAALEEHMRKSHKRAWATMQDLQEERRRQEDRELQLQILQSNVALMQAMVASRPQAVQQPELPVAVIDPKAIESHEAESLDKIEPGFTVSCSQCGQAFTKASLSYARIAVKAHMRAKHKQS